ncbi:FKBP-type peptidyl-prolyl cis-trans isomerase [Pedobacter deserti]|uniref:FKBP-type peptidyl-prolyl cis-trans isomerase n=1 Tax=Pedobacter deserti TaxID=2817382 RepID=UPI00210D56AE|nr:FKBP-type peptidyl-prolyl cis-trans isomerase [Pedobacter sp. SYSU D00382]
MVRFKTELKMNNLLILIVLCSISTACAQSQINSRRTSKKSEVEGSTLGLQTRKDSLSYAMGLKAAKSYAKQGVTEISKRAFSLGAADVIDGSKVLLSEAEMDIIIMEEVNPKVAATIKNGLAFLKANKSRPEIRSTQGGLQYEILVSGTGTKPTISDTVIAHYEGKLLDGKVFDSTYGEKDPVAFPLKNTIGGWIQGIPLMSVGSKYRFYVPYHLAYGTNGRQGIPGGSLLIFDVELLNVKSAALSDK